VAIDVDAAPLINGHSQLVYGAMAAPKGRNKIATETKTLKVGDAAPDFTLKAHDNREVTLSKLRGQRVVLAFFAFAFTNT
jgi:cytochrome oxidase Cu insertion factor (SCO1/SenC/PrrC family)